MRSPAPPADEIVVVREFNSWFCVSVKSANLNTGFAPAFLLGGGSQPTSRFGASLSDYDWARAVARLTYSYTARAANGARGADPTPNPAASCAPPTADNVTVCKQDLVAGGGFAMARKLTCVPAPAGEATSSACVMLLSLTNSVPAGVRNKEDASTLALAAIKSAGTTGVSALKAAHAEWWLGTYWPRSMLSVPDAVVESFHAIQLYKVGSATRCDGPDNCWAMDLAMPWYVPIQVDCTLLQCCVSNRLVHDFVYDKT